MGATPPSKSRFPVPRTAGLVQRWRSSTKSSRCKGRRRLELLLRIGATFVAKGPRAGRNARDNPSRRAQGLSHPFQVGGLGYVGLAMEAEGGVSSARVRGALWVAVAAQLVIFIVSLPGFGIETRKPSDYSVWAGPIFLLLTILVIVLGLGFFAVARRRPRSARRLAVGQAFAAIATNVLDISHVGGPAPPNGPLVLGILSIIVAVATLWAAG